jgi:hypothetical protein
MGKGSGSGKGGKGGGAGKSAGRSMSKAASSRIQSSAAKNPGGKTAQSGFDERAQSAADRAESKESQQQTDK